MEEKKITILVDGVSTIGVHNGIIRISFFQSAANGKSEIVLELQIPQHQIKHIVDALVKVSL